MGGGVGGRRFEGEGWVAVRREVQGRARWQVREGGTGERGEYTGARGGQ